MGEDDTCLLSVVAGRMHLWSALYTSAWHRALWGAHHPEVGNQCDDHPIPLDHQPQHQGRCGHDDTGRQCHIAAQRMDGT